MGATAKEQRRRADREPAYSCVIRVEMKDWMGNPQCVTADLVDIIDGGCGLALMTPLKSGSTVVVRGKLGQNRAADYVNAGVRWCVGKTDGTFRAGLEFLGGRSTIPRDEEQTNSITPDTLDCYEVMQVSPNADPEIISRVYRVLASRYHPDNANTGNSEMFLRLSEAHEILSDPQKRARYDASHSSANELRGKILDRAPVFPRSEWEKRKNLEVVTAYLGVISLDCTQERGCWEG